MLSGCVRQIWPVTLQALDAIFPAVTDWEDGSGLALLAADASPYDVA